MAAARSAARPGAAAPARGRGGAGVQLLTSRRGMGMTGSASLMEKPLGVAAFDVEAQTGTAAIGPQDAAIGTRRAVEQHLLDAHVVVEVLEVARARRRAAQVDVQ